MRWGYCYSHFMESRSYWGPGDKESYQKLWTIGELVNSKLHLGVFEPFPCGTALSGSLSLSCGAGQIIRGDSTKLLSKEWRSGCLTSGSWGGNGGWELQHPLSSAVPASPGPEALGMALFYLFSRMGKRQFPGCVDMAKESGGVTAS